MRIDRQQDARIAGERHGRVGDCGQGHPERAPQRLQEAAFGGLERPAVEGGHARAACARVHGGGLKQRRLAHTRNTVDDGHKRRVALDQLEQRGPFPLAPDERAGALIERRLQGARPHRLPGESIQPRSVPTRRAVGA
jgi:hypothetical protein